LMGMMVKPSPSKNAENSTPSLHKGTYTRAQRDNKKNQVGRQR
jgi:hypothetical protein